MGAGAVGSNRSNSAPEWGLGVRSTAITQQHCHLFPTPTANQQSLLGRLFTRSRARVFEK